MNTGDTIAAVATGAGGALAVIRVSGSQAITVCDGVFIPVSGKPLARAAGYTLHYGEIVGEKGILDDVIVSVYRAPLSYTGEDMIEISCHGSRYIQQQIINLLIEKGVRTAEAGEFTVRAFMAGKLDLSQAEAVADMIASTDRATHALASNQMRGGYSAEFAVLRDELVQLVSLIELELDFGEEDVEFADRSRLSALLTEIETKIASLLATFSLGNAIKEGVAVAIAGSPNVGKSTLLNALLNEDRAMVSDIAGTTRDVIEESVNIDGVRFRFIDTAGIRETVDVLEQMGIERTFGSIGKANIILYMVEAGADEEATLRRIVDSLAGLGISSGQRLCIIINKLDKTTWITDNTDWEQFREKLNGHLTVDDIRIAVDHIIAISAKQGMNIGRIREYLHNSVDTSAVFNGETIVANSRHYEALSRSSEALSRAHEALTENIPADLLSQDIREALHYLGVITGEITTDEVLGSIFSKFCIGK